MSFGKLSCILRRLPSFSPHVRNYSTAFQRPLRVSLPDKIEELTKDYTSVMTQAVAWGDQDSFGHLNNVIYLRYFESARMAYFESLRPYLDKNFYDKFVSAREVGPIVKSITCNYRQVVQYPDTLALATRVTSMKSDRFTMEYAGFSFKTSSLIADGEAVVVTYDYRIGKKAPVPDVLRDLFEKLQRGNTL